MASPLLLLLVLLHAVAALRMPTNLLCTATGADMSVTQPQGNWRFETDGDTSPRGTASCTFSSSIDTLVRPFVLQLHVYSNATSFEGEASSPTRDFIKLADGSVLTGPTSGDGALRDATRGLTITGEGGWWEVAITTEDTPVLEVRLTGTGEIVGIAQRAYVSTACVQRADTACPTSIPDGRSCFALGWMCFDQPCFNPPSQSRVTSGCGDCTPCEYDEASACTRLADTVCGPDNLVPSIKYKSQYGDADIQPTSAVEMVYASLSQTYQQGSFDVTDEPNTEDIQVKPGVSSHTVDLEQVGSVTTLFTAVDATNNTAFYNLTTVVMDMLAPIITYTSNYRRVSNISSVNGGVLQAAVVEVVEASLTGMYTLGQLSAVDLPLQIMLNTSKARKDGFLAAVKLDVLGDIKNTFSVRDQSGNQAQLLLTTRVVDTTEPAITLSGWLSPPRPLVQWPYGVPWQSSWVSAQDSLDGTRIVTFTEPLVLSHFDPRNLTIQLMVSDNSDNSATTSLELMIEAFDRPSSEYVVRLDASSSFTVSSQEHVRASLQRHLGTAGFVIVFPFETRRRDGNVSLDRLEFGVRHTTTLAWLAQTAVSPDINVSGVGDDLGLEGPLIVYQPPLVTEAPAGSSQGGSLDLPLAAGGAAAALIFVVIVIMLVIRRQRKTLRSDPLPTPDNTSSNHHGTGKRALSAWSSELYAVGERMEAANEGDAMIMNPTFQPRGTNTWSIDLYAVGDGSSTPQAAVEALEGPSQINREEACVLLEGHVVGAYVLRSRDGPGCMAISLVHDPTSIAHYRLTEVEGRYFLQDKQLPALPELSAVLSYLATSEGAAFAGLGQPLRSRVSESSTVA